MLNMWDLRAESVSSLYAMWVRLIPTMAKEYLKHNTENLQSLREKKKMPSTIVSSTLESKYELV